MFGRKPKSEPEQLIIEVAKSDAKKPTQQEIRAQKFVLTDGEGKTRARLQCAGKGGAVALTFHDGDEKMRLLLGLDPKQAPTLVMLEDGRPRAGLEVDAKTGQPSLTLSGTGESKIQAGFDAGNKATINLHDGTGQMRVSISLDANGQAQVALYDSKGYVREKLRPE